MSANQDMALRTLLFFRSVLETSLRWAWVAEGGSKGESSKKFYPLQQRQDRPSQEMWMRSWIILKLSEELISPSIPPARPLSAVSIQGFELWDRLRSKAHFSPPTSVPHFSDSRETPAN
ncbi:hypothetical protein L6164_034144 [Bauhinia variegata]|uniref:Uncharacterized protein n=1 Tax=Bauhinia variegata TaxID=167791 RepID=A0ACB9KUB2_BAUVA|nr:hypothetical protein L6164_034144 [Bauhinia variegata]